MDGEGGISLWILPFLSFWHFFYPFLLFRLYISFHGNLERRSESISKLRRLAEVTILSLHPYIFLRALHADESFTGGKEIGEINVQKGSETHLTISLFSRHSFDFVLVKCV